MQTVIISQPYVPRYRVEFFELLRQQLALEGVNCVVQAADPAGASQQRNDLGNLDWLTRVKRREIHVGGRTVIASIGGSWRGADAVIVPAQGTSLETYRALVARATQGLRVGLWGHIKDYVNPTHPLDAALERWQLRHADHIFAYTPGGAAYAKDLGVRDGKITTVMNSIDTLSLSRTWKAVSPERLDAYRLSHGLRPGRTLAYIGGIDGSKRIEFLVAALDQLFESDPDVRVLIGGRGSQEALLNRAFRRGQAVLLGHVDVQERALIGRAASAMLMPGRIGLVAVDCLVMRLPILTTDWPYHAPEAEYLTEGVSKITLASDPEGYARGIGEYLRRSPRPDVSSTHWRAPSLQQMVSNYREGIKALLGEGR